MSININEDFLKTRYMSDRYVSCFNGLKMCIKDKTFCKLGLLGLFECIVILIIMFIGYLPMTTPFIIFFFPITVEILNTSIESAVDHTSIEISFLAGKAKDTAAAASLVIHIGVTIYWLQLLFNFFYILTEYMLLSVNITIFVCFISIIFIHCNIDN